MAYIKENEDGTFEYSMGLPEPSEGWEKVSDDDERCINSRKDKSEYNIHFFKKSLRIIRNQLLNHSDRYMFSDYPLEEVSLDDVKIYRKALRDFPATITEIPSDGLNALAWPVDPVYNNQNGES